MTRVWNKIFLQQRGYTHATTGNPMLCRKHIRFVIVSKVNCFCFFLCLLIHKTFIKIHKRKRVGLRNSQKMFILMHSWQHNFILLKIPSFRLNKVKFFSFTAKKNVFLRLSNLMSLENHIHTTEQVSTNGKFYQNMVEKKQKKSIIADTYSLIHVQTHKCTK
jgi:hypothetical protein